MHEAFEIFLEFCQIYWTRDKIDSEKTLTGRRERQTDLRLAGPIVLSTICMSECSHTIFTLPVRNVPSH